MQKDFMFLISLWSTFGMTTMLRELRAAPLPRTTTQITINPAPHAKDNEQSLLRAV